VLDAAQPWAGYCFQVLSSKAANAVIAMTICCAFMMGQGCMVAACIFPPPQQRKLTSSPSYLRIRTRWLFPTLAILVSSQYDYSNSCQCRVVQCPRRRSAPFTHFCGRSSHWRTVFRRRNLRLCGFYYSHLNPCVFRG
jgi:hypothetical protein